MNCCITARNVVTLTFDHTIVIIYVFESKGTFQPNLKTFPQDVLETASSQK